MELLTQKAYAESRGVSKQYINKLVKQQKIVLTGGKVDPATADSAIAQTRQRPAQSKMTPPPDSPIVVRDVTLTEAQTRKLLIDAARGEIKRAKESREAIAIADAERAMQQFAANIRSRLLGLPSKLAPRLAVTDTPAKARALLTTEVREILEELAASAGAVSL